MVDNYEVVTDEEGTSRVRVTWKCYLCKKLFVVYDPPKDHLNECLVYLVNKV